MEEAEYHNFSLSNASRSILSILSCCSEGGKKVLIIKRSCSPQNVINSDEHK